MKMLINDSNFIVLMLVLMKFRKPAQGTDISGKY